MGLDEPIRGKTGSESASQSASVEKKTAPAGHGSQSRSQQHHPGAPLSVPSMRSVLHGNMAAQPLVRWILSGPFEDLSLEDSSIDAYQLPVPLEYTCRVVGSYAWWQIHAQESISVILCISEQGWNKGWKARRKHDMPRKKGFERLH